MTAVVDSVPKLISEWERAAEKLAFRQQTSRKHEMEEGVPEFTTYFTGKEIAAIWPGLFFGCLVPMQISSANCLGRQADTWTGSASSGATEDGFRLEGSWTWMHRKRHHKENATACFHRKQTKKTLKLRFSL